jgi:hypothetical protein
MRCLECAQPLSMRGERYPVIFNVVDRPETRDMSLLCNRCSTNPTKVQKILDRVLLKASTGGTG